MASTSPTARDTRPAIKVCIYVHPALIENVDRASLIQVLGQEVINEAQRKAGTHDHTHP